MSNLGLGKLITTPQNRDAIHVALIPIVAGQILYPGQHVALNAKKEAIQFHKESCIGIADPFLTQMIQPGETFWLFLYENTVTGMRHHWEHPAFSADIAPVSARDPECESKQWLEQCAKRCGVSYDVLIDRLSIYATGNSTSDDHLYDSLQGENDHDEIWRHYEKVTGDTRGEYFSCSC